MKWLKRIISMALCFTLMSSSTVMAAETAPSYYSKDIYADHLQEKIDVNGTEVIYTYGVDKQNNNYIEVFDTTKNERSIVVYDKQQEQFFVDDELVAKINDVCENFDETLDSNVIAKAAAPYKYLGTKSKRITWKKGVSVAVLAALVALAINGNFGAAGVIAKIGATALSVIAGCSVNGVITTKTYSRTSGKVTNYKFVWTFNPNNNDKYGPYTSYVTV